MDIPSNNCFAWICRSTCPFQIFLVSNIGLLWLGTTKHVCRLSYLGKRTISLPTLGQIQPRSGIESGWEPPCPVPCFRLSTHTYHRFGLSVELCGDLCPSLLDSSCLFHHTCILGSSITSPYTRLPPASNLVEFLVFSAERSSENPYHTRGNLDF